MVLRPGIQRTPGGGFESITSNGLRPEDNNFLVDGVDDNDPYYSGNIINGEGVQGTPGSILPIDAIQEFNTEENPSAEYGYKPGATINIGLKSGTNTPHGTAYYFGRNSALDARNFFNTVPSPQNGLRQHQFGASFGGPIIHDRLFIFGVYEGVRALVSNSDLIQTPETVYASLQFQEASCRLSGQGNPHKKTLEDAQSRDFGVRYSICRKTYCRMPP